jgi:hypothetical protein
MKEMQEILIEPLLLTNLNTVEFANLTFTFENKTELISFMLQNQYMNPLSNLSNISYALIDIKT